MTINFLAKWRQVSLLTAAFLILATISACKKKDIFLGQSALDQDALLTSSATDTFSIYTSTIVEDSIITSKTLLNLLGKYNDPKFGEVEAEFYTQFRLSGVNPNFGNINDIVIDSFVLGMQYAGSYGNISSFDIGVYEMVEDIYFDSTYYSFSQKNTNGIDLIDHSNGNIMPDLSTNTIVGEDTILPQIRIPLDTNKARQLIIEAMSGSGTFASNEAFAQYFKGLNVRLNSPMPSSNNGGVLYFDNISSNSNLTIFYRSAGVAKKFVFLINADCANFNRVLHDHTGTDVQNVIDNPSEGQDQFYAQALDSRAWIQIPGLSNIPKKAVVLSAFLVLPVQVEAGSKYPLPLTINVLTKEKASDNGFVISQITATYDAFRRAYILNIRDHLQRVNFGILENTGLYINPLFFNNSVERIIFNGVNTTNKEKPELIIKYTEF